MQSSLSPEHQEPDRAGAVLFFIKSRLLIARRWWRERGRSPAIHPRGPKLGSARVAFEARAALWTQISPAEFPMTAGKVQNLRAACLRLDGVEVPAGEVFSFWKQLGRTTRAAGFTEGRELRSGCLIPTLGGGLCQLSGLLHAAAVGAGLEVVERHKHSRILPGSAPDPDRDATVYWNYVDLRFRAPFAWRLEARLTATDLIVSIRAAADALPSEPRSQAAVEGMPVRSVADGDCLTCGVVSCFRHPSANRAHKPAAGHTAWLLDGLWPEFDTWCRSHSQPDDRWMTPLDGHRWKKPNYAWTPPANTVIHHATLQTLCRSWRQRRLPGQGAVRQKFLLTAQLRLAENFARRLDPQARHLVISQTLLPHLWKEGHLGGRTFDVLANRWPLSELQSRLDAAAARHPQSDTLVDFRADPALVHAETEAFKGAARIITPHRAIAALFGSRALLLDWEMPVKSSRAKPVDGVRWFFPASPLGRKGIHELAAALRETGGELLVLGKARERGEDVLAALPHRKASPADLTNCTALVIPAWIEHEPRLALRALAMGVPVIASRSCGLEAHPLLTEVTEGDVASLSAAMRKVAVQPLVLA